jgi:hypothetical protein
MLITTLACAAAVSAYCFGRRDGYVQGLSDGRASDFPLMRRADDELIRSTVERMQMKTEIARLRAITQPVAQH